MLSAATKLLVERGTELPEGKTIAVPRLRGAGQENQKGDRPWYIDASLVPNPASVGYWVVDPHANQPIHLPGTVVILDTSANDSTDLQPFWDKVVLVESTGESTPIKTGLPGPGPGLHMGRLCFAVRGSGECTECRALLCPPDRPRLSWSHEDLGSTEYIHFGQWTISMTTAKWRLENRRRSGDFDTQLVWARAKEEVRLFRGCTILGRVVYWFRPPKQGK
jgi:hypothetical protein